MIILDYLSGRQPLGLAMLRQKRRCPCTAKLPVILCSGSVVSAEQEHASDLRDPVVRLLAKPFHMEQLINTVEALLRPLHGTLVE